MKRRTTSKTFGSEIFEMKDVEVAELMVHPAYIDDYLCHHSSYNVNNSLELEALTTVALKIKIDIVLTDFEEEALCRK